MCPPIPQRFSGHSIIKKTPSENEREAAWPLLTNSSESRQAQEWLQHLPESPGVLDPLVCALSDLQVVLSHLIMAQAPWIFKERLSDTCQTSLTRLMEGAIVSVRQMIGGDGSVVAVKTFLMHRVVLANRMWLWMTPIMGKASFADIKVSVPLCQLEIDHSICLKWWECPCPNKDTAIYLVWCLLFWPWIFEISYLF